MKPKKKVMPVGDSISTRKSGWKFDENVAEHFDEHVRRSVPLYEKGHDLVCELSDFFVQDGSVAYELGTSTGELIEKLASHNKHKEVKWVGLDNEESMIAKARKRCVKFKNIDLEKADIAEYEYEKTDLIVSYYTIQFVSPKRRQDLFNRIYDALNWGGALLLFEKVRGPDARFQDMTNLLYTSFKLENNYSPQEIIAKSESLKGVLEPFSSQGNIDLLKRAGFVDIMSIMKYICFEGFVAIK
jgi:tRNA (cmo5U34)-methyltransferase